MKILITGHTNGIGKALYDELSKEHEVIGFSKSTGYDISNHTHRQIIAFSDYDVFINNAYNHNITGYDSSQLEMLSMLDYDTKIIINISSRITDVDFDMDDATRQYRKAKQEQDRYCSGRPIINIKPAHIATRMQDFVGRSPQAVVDVVKYALQPRDFQLHTITLS
jgi:nucleoside-diphosphate-sugar epimerase